MGLHDPGKDSPYAVVLVRNLLNAEPHATQVLVICHGLDRFAQPGQRGGADTDAERPHSTSGREERWGVVSAFLRPEGTNQLRPSGKEVRSRGTRQLVHLLPPDVFACNQGLLPGIGRLPKILEAYIPDSG